MCQNPTSYVRLKSAISGSNHATTSLTVSSSHSSIGLRKHSILNLVFLPDEMPLLLKLTSNKYLSQNLIDSLTLFSVSFTIADLSCANSSQYMQLPVLTVIDDTILICNMPSWRLYVALLPSPQHCIFISFPFIVIITSANILFYCLISKVNDNYC